MATKSLSRLPKTASDVELLLNTMQKASYNNIQFGVVSYEVNTGRNWIIEEWTGANAEGIRTTTAVDAGSKIATMAANVDPSKLNPKLNQPPKKIDASSELQVPQDGEPHIYPKGMIAQTVKLRAFFISNPTPTFTISVEPYMLNRDAFIEATNDEVPKILQLPSYGPFLAVAGRVTSSFTYDKLGIEYVDVEFYKATTDIAIPKIDYRNYIASKNREVYSAISTDTAYTYTSLLADNENSSGSIPTSTATSFKDSITNSINTLITGVKSISSSVISTIEEKKASLDKYIRQVTAITDNISSAILAPAQLLDDLTQSYQTLADAITSPIEAYNFMRNKLEIFLNDIESITYETLDAVGLYDLAIKTYHVSATFSEVCSAIGNKEYVSTSEAIADSEELNALMARVAIISEFHEYRDTYAALDSLYGYTAKYLTEQIALVPDVRTIRTSENTPLIVTAYKLYADPSRSTEIANRNEAKSKLFPPIELEVLSE